MALNPDKFAKIAESLRQYRRAELGDFEQDVEGNPIDTLYVDALEGDAVLKTVLLNSTTFLVGRKAPERVRSSRRRKSSFASATL